MSKKYKKTYKYLNYVENLLILSLTNTGCVSIPVFFFITLCFCLYYNFCNRNKNLCKSVSQL